MGEIHSASRFPMHIELFFFNVQILGQILSSLPNSLRVCTSATTQRKELALVQLFTEKQKLPETIC